MGFDRKPVLFLFRDAAATSSLSDGINHNFHPQLKVLLEFKQGTAFVCSLFPSTVCFVSLYDNGFIAIVTLEVLYKSYKAILCSSL